MRLRTILMKSNMAVNFNQQLLDNSVFVNKYGFVGVYFFDGH